MPACVATVFTAFPTNTLLGRLREFAPHLAAGRVIAAHLGNGASLCAMADGKSVDSTMGFTALDGLVMGTRCGSIDAGVLLYLMQARGMTADDITALLYKKSGLLGVSGISADMRTLLASPEPAAAEAVDLFTYTAARHAGALAAVARGIRRPGFHRRHRRTRAGNPRCHLRHACLARRQNLAGSQRENAPVISTADSRIEIRVIPTDEEAMIAQHCLHSCSSRKQDAAFSGSEVKLRRTAASPAR